MDAPPHPIPHELLRRFLDEHIAGRPLCAALCGAHASGYAVADAPLELKAIHLEPTAVLVGLHPPAATLNWVGEYEGVSIDFSSSELGLALALLLRGNGTLLERLLSPLQVHQGPELKRLQELARGMVSRIFFNFYKDFSRAVLKDYEGHPPHTARRVLQAYRSGLTGLNLLQRGELELRLDRLIERHRLPHLAELVARYQQNPAEVVPRQSRWVNGLAPLLVHLERAYDRSSLPVDPQNPGEVERYLIEVRRDNF